MASKHLPTLDGWRFIAILAVLCSHIRWPVPEMVRVGNMARWASTSFSLLADF